MVTYPVWDMSGQIGTVAVGADGLYAAVTATLPDCRRLLRLWLVGESETILLGTPVPVGAQMQCRRRIAQRQLPRGLLGAVALGSELGQWQKDGTLCCRMEGTQLQIAEAYREDGAIRQLEAYPRLRVVQIKDSLYLACQCTLQSLILDMKTPRHRK